MGRKAETKAADVGSDGGIDNAGGYNVMAGECIWSPVVFYTIQVLWDPALELGCPIGVCMRHVFHYR